MSIKRSGISIDCAHCQFIDDGDNGDFDVQVPLADDDTGLAGIATLQCKITPQNHQVAMIDWHDADARSIDPPAALQDRLDGVLAYIERRRVCGNEKICPPDVIRIVEQIEQ
ncbi:MAG: hypothetical protein QNJ69_04990 [Gammaproteobacteria bacterium]|nr:hypothetical protein [Gammaproteobacteria bacterium]